jgi:hypothetical protein
MLSWNVGVLQIVNRQGKAIGKINKEVGMAKIGIVGSRRRNTQEDFLLLMGKGK